MKKFTISLAQMEVSTGRPDKNVKTARRMLEMASKRGSDLVLLPELWSSGYDLERARDHAGFNQELEPQLARWSTELNLAIGGSLITSDSAGCFNTFTLFLPGNPEPYTYRKIHLFGLMQEERYLQPGDHLTTVAAPWGRTGLAVCYDLRFPELFRAYAVDGAVLMLLVAQWPKCRSEHWRGLLRARAIENQSFVAAVNAAGTAEGDGMGGYSAVISPWGEVLAEGAEGEDLITVVVDLDQVAEAREKIPVFRDRRTDLY